jgi:hypothetical protein
MKIAIYIKRGCIVLTHPLLFFALLVDARRGYSPLAAWRSSGVCFILIFTSTGAPLLHFYCESAFSYP